MFGGSIKSHYICGVIINNLNKKYYGSGKDYQTCNEQEC